MKNEYIPYPVKIEKISRETFDTKTYTVKFVDEKLRETFEYVQGQFMEVSILGIGEAPISITSSPSRKGYLEFTIRATGKVTDKIHTLKVGDTMHLRGPYGNSFPFDELKGKNIYFIAGGIGLAPLRSLINMVFDNRKEFGHIEVLYGSKTPDELCSKEELEEWSKIPDTKVFLTVDNGNESWSKRVGVVTELWKDTEVKSDNAIAVVCGPPIMIKFVCMKLAESGFTDENIIMTLERYMKCGIGKCGHCNIGEKFVCVHGPVFTYEEVKKMPKKENIF